MIGADAADREYAQLNDSVALSNKGFLIIQNDGKKGRMIFWLGELEVGELFITAGGSTLLRLSPRDVRFKHGRTDVRMLVVPPEPAALVQSRPAEPTKAESSMWSRVGSWFGGGERKPSPAPKPKPAKSASRPASRPDMFPEPSPDLIPEEYRARAGAGAGQAVAYLANDRGVRSAIGEAIAERSGDSYMASLARNEAVQARVAETVTSVAMNPEVQRQAADMAVTGAVKGAALAGSAARTLAQSKEARAKAWSFLSAASSVAAAAGSAAVTAYMTPEEEQAKTRMRQ